jgi:hypothetical protein
MFPLSAEKLSFLKISDYWSRESLASQNELLAQLEAAWWRGEISGNSAITRLQFLEKMYRSRHEPYLQSVVFITPSDAGTPTEIPLPDGGIVVRPEILVPGETDDWTENSCSEAFEALAGLPSRQHFPLLSYSICFIDLTHEEFFSWARTRDFDLPTFWRAVALNREEFDKEERKLTAKGPRERKDLREAYKQRIVDYSGKKSPSRTDDEQWVREKFPGLSSTKARDLRRKFAPRDWTKPGRRKCKFRQK